MNNLLHRGSVKDIYRLDDEHLMFEFSNRYSLFDWGAMPNEIPHKGEALAKFTKNIYLQLANPKFWQEYLKINTPIALELKQNGLKTHLVNHDAGVNQIVVREVSCPRDSLDFYQTKPNDAFIPLEVIFRCGVPAGSSLLKRSPELYQAGQILESPLVECSTKWEAQDRMIDWNEAKQIAGLEENEAERLMNLTSALGMALAEFFKSRGLELWDGKVEWAFVATKTGRDFMLVDSIGPDELRLNIETISLSKEFLRSWYRNTPWFKELTRAKNIHGDSFKSFCEKPPMLPSAMLEDMTQMYQQLARCLDEKVDFSPLTQKLSRWV